MSFQANQIGKKVLKAFDEMEGFSPDLKACVHEFGLPIVRACLHAGVRDPSRIRTLVAAIWCGARNVGQKQTHPVDVLDWLLPQQEGPLSTKTLVRLIHMNGYVMAPRVANGAMIEASLRALDGVGLVTKREKHHRRLIAALRAAELSLEARLAGRR